MKEASSTFKKALIERVIGAELGHCLGDPASAKPEDAGNKHNGTSADTAIIDGWLVRIEVLHECDGSIHPNLIPKHERRFTDTDDKIAAMSVPGMTMREIQETLLERYTVEVSREFICSASRESFTSETTPCKGKPLVQFRPVK
ncbi:MAG: transposase [Akkermansiaceae bacterium]|nr:transposase [Akkermansiaceae bacterium]